MPRAQKLCRRKRYHSLQPLRSRELLSESGLGGRARVRMSHPCHFESPSENPQLHTAAASWEHDPAPGRAAVSTDRCEVTTGDIAGNPSESAPTRRRRGRRPQEMNPAEWDVPQVRAHRAFVHVAC